MNEVIFLISSLIEKDFNLTLGHQAASTLLR